MQALLLVVVIVFMINSGYAAVDENNRCPEGQENAKLCTAETTEYYNESIRSEILRIFAIGFYRSKQALGCERCVEAVNGLRKKLPPNLSKSSFKLEIFSVCSIDDCTEFFSDHLNTLYDGYKGMITPTQACSESICNSV